MKIKLKILAAAGLILMAVAVVCGVRHQLDRADGANKSNAGWSTYHDSDGDLIIMRKHDDGRHTTWSIPLR